MNTIDSRQQFQYEFIAGVSLVSWTLSSFFFFGRRQIRNQCVFYTDLVKYISFNTIASSKVRLFFLRRIIC